MRFWISKLKQWYRFKGLLYTLQRCLQKLGTLVYEGPYTFFYADLTKMIFHGNVMPADISIECCKCEGDISPLDRRVLSEHIREQDLQHDMKERFSKGASFWLVKVNGNLAGYIWTIRGTTIEPYICPLTADDVHFFDNLIFENFRGRGINPILVNFVLAEMQKQLCVRAFIETRMANTAEVRSLAKTDFQKCGIAKKRLFWRRKSLGIWRKIPPAWVDLSEKHIEVQASTMFETDVGMGDKGIICFGDSDWWYHNRGHMDIQLMKRYAQSGKVLYVNSIVVRKINIKEGAMLLHRVNRKLGSIMRGMKPSGIENMTVYSPFSMPVHHINFARQLNASALRLQISRCMRKLNMTKPLIWVACPGAAEVAVKLPRMKLVYQRSDCYEEFPCVDADQIKRYDKLLKKHADLVVYANKRLLMREEQDCHKAIYVDHGVDYELFAKAHENPYIPTEMKMMSKPILGFYGGIDAHTSDVSLIENVADLLPDISVVLIGNASVDLTRLRSRKNVYLLPQKPYEEIPHYAKCFDVCFMPWQQNNWIAACNPVKLKEYLALGKPVVSTPFSELANYDGLISMASDAQSFAYAVKRALEENNPEFVARRRKRVAADTWDAKSQVILQRLFQTPL